MTHPIYRVVEFEIAGPYALRIRFDDDTVQTVDFRPVLRGEMYGPLRDPAVFRQVRVDPETGTLEWPNGADFEPATLHDWPVYAEEMARRANTWQTAGTIPR